MKTFLAILGVLILVAGVVFATQFITRSSYAQNTGFVHALNAPQFYPQPSFHADIQDFPQPTFQADIKSLPQPQLVASFAPPVDLTPTVISSSNPNSNHYSNQLSSPIQQPVVQPPVKNLSNRFANQASGTFATPQSTRFAQPPPNSKQWPKSVAPQVKKPFANNQSFSVANFNGSASTPPVRASAWPKNAQHVKNLVRTHYFLPSEAAESIVKFFAADNNEDIETRVVSEEGSGLVTLIVTTDEKTQRAIAAFLDAVYPASRIKELKTADEVDEELEDMGSEEEPKFSGVVLVPDAEPIPDALEPFLLNKKANHIERTNDD